MLTSVITIDNYLNLRKEPDFLFASSQPAFTCSKSTIETPEQCIKPVQS